MSPDPLSKPNVLFIFSDQQHWQAMGCIDPFFNTPNLDAFAKECVFFENSFCTTPQCSPSRSSMLTGFYPTRTGMMGNVGNAGGTPLDMATIGSEWQAAGYRTGYFGKWHLGDAPQATAGWDEKFFKIDDSLAKEKAIRFLEESTDSVDPFALVVSINNPHDIYSFLKHEPEGSLEEVPLPESWEKETFEGKPAVQRQFMEEDQGTAIEGQPTAIWQKYHDCYREKTRLFDEHVGQILDAVERSGKREETLVILTSDHGDMDAQHRLIFKGPFFYEHLIRVPLMIRMPESFESVPPRHVNDVDVVNVDVVPTLRDFCGLPEKESHGLSLHPLLTSSGTYTSREFVVGQYYSKQKWVNPMRMIRMGDYKLNRHLSGELELYDLGTDPHELVNVAEDPGYTELTADLNEKLDRWMQEHHDPFATFQNTDRDGNLLNGKRFTSSSRKPIGIIAGE